MIELVWKTLFILLCIYFVNCQLNDDTTSPLAKPTLVKVFVAIRHGSRAPTYDSYVNDTYKKDDVKFWPDGAGQLTKNGKLEAYDIGEKLRSRYSAFLGDYFNTTEFRVFSTLKERTMVTAQLAAAAIFPPRNYQKWSDEFKWNPLPVFPDIVNTSDNLICEKFIPIIQNEVNNMPLKEFGYNKEDIELLQDVMRLNYDEGSTYIHSTYTFLSKLWDVWDTIYFQDKANLTLPKWTKNLYPKKISYGVLKFVTFFLSGSEERKMVTTDPYVKALANFFEKSQRKMELHVWHDVSVIGLLTTLDLEIEKYPDITAAVAIELHKKNDGYYFEVYYYSNHKQTVPKLMRMPCGTSCRFSVMKELFATYAKIKIDELCAIKSNKNSFLEYNTYTTL